MHILKIIHGYPPQYNAGSEVYSQSICTELSKYHKVSVFTREENPYIPCFSIREEKINENLTLYLVNHPQGKDSYKHQKMDNVFTSLLETFIGSSIFNALLLKFLLLMLFHFHQVMYH